MFSRITIIFVIVICLGLPYLKGQNMVTVHPKEYPNAISNPLMGFRPYDDDWSKYKYPTIVHEYIKWNEIENDESDTIDKIRNWCNTQWAGFESANIKVIPRVYIDWDSKSGNEYWPADLKNGDWTSQEFKERVVRLIYRLGEVWDTDPRIAWVQTGIIGYWGEQENPVGVDEDGWVERMGKAFEDAFPNKLLVVRNQNYWDAEDYKWGVYWDSFAHPGQESGSWSRIRNTNSQGRYLTHPVEGEVAYNWGSGPEFYGNNPNETLTNPQYYNYLIDVIKELHCSALGWVASYDQNSSTKQGANQVQKAFGYRFVLNEFSCSKQTEPGGTLNLNFKVLNNGSANMFERWPVAFALIDSSTHKIVWKTVLSDIDIRTWNPGDHYDYSSRKYASPPETHTIDASIIIPPEIPVGTYMAGLTILEPYSRTPGIFFAIENFLAESQTQPLCLVSIGGNYTGNYLIDSTIFADPVLYNNRYYSLDWSGPKYSLTTNSTTGGSVNPISNSYPENSNVRLKAKSELGFKFSEWSGDLTGSENPVTITMDKDKSITANFISVPTYNLITNSSHGSILIDPPGGLYNEGSIIKISVNPDLGYLFTEWSGDLSGSENPATITMDSDKSIIANFIEAEIFTLNTHAVGGNIEIDPAGPQYTEGTIVKLKAVADQGYLFVRWSGDPLNYEFYFNPNFVTMDSDKNVTADFIVDPEYADLIKNGDFTAGMNKWTPQVISPAKANLFINNSEFKAEITSVSDEPWHINILQAGVSLEYYKSYTLTFDARAETKKVIVAKAQFDHDPWTSSLEEEIEITDIMKKYSVTWFQEQPTASYKVGFFFGTDTIDVWIDNVKLSQFLTDINFTSERILPEKNFIMQNYPNPFNPTTTLNYQISKNSIVSLKIYNVMGELVKTLVEGNKSVGFHQAQWDGKDDNNQSVVSGIYLYSLRADDFIQTRKMLLLK